MGEISYGPTHPPLTIPRQLGTKSQHPYFSIGVWDLEECSSLCKDQYYGYSNRLGEFRILWEAIPSDVETNFLCQKLPTDRHDKKTNNFHLAKISRLKSKVGKEGGGDSYRWKISKKKHLIHESSRSHPAGTWRLSQNYRGNNRIKEMQSSFRFDS